MKIKKNSVRNRGAAWIFNGLALVTMMLFLIEMPALGQYSSANTTQIKINSDTISSGEAVNGYPSTVSVPPSVAGTLEKVTVTLDGFTHGYPNDVVLLLVAPNNNAVALMGNDGGGVSVTDLILTFDDVAAGAQTLGVATSITSGTYKTGDNATYGTNAVQFPAPAPNVTFQPNLAALTASLTPAVGAPTNYTGTWSLYVLDDSQPNTGSIASWSLNLYTEPVVAVTNTSVSIAENQSSNFFFTVGDANTNGTLTASITLGAVNNGNIGYTNASGSFSNFISAGDFVFNGGSPISANGTNMLTITPNANLYGVSSFQISLKDANGVTVQSSIIDLTVTHVAVAPQISLANSTITTTEGVATTTNLISLISVDGNAGSTMQFSVSATNTIGNIGVNSNVFTNYAGLPASMPPSSGRTNNLYFSIVPGGFPVGTTYLNFIATDPTAGLSATQLVTVVVNPLTNGTLTGPLVFSNTNSLIVPSGSSSSGTLGSITITNLSRLGSIGNVTVSILGLTNIVPQYLGLELQAPDGTQVPLIGTAGGGSASTYAELTFADSAGTPNVHGNNNLPAASGTVLTNYVLNATASATALAAALGGHSPTNVGPNVWTLTVSNYNAGSALGISGGWVLVVYPAPAVQASVQSVTVPESTPTNIVFVTSDTLGVQSGTPTVTLSPSTTQNYSGTALAGSSIVTSGTAIIGGTNFTTNILTLTGNYNETGSANVVVVFSETNGPAGVAPSTFTVTSTTLLTVTFVAQPPTIGFIENQVTFAGDAILNIPFVISSPDTNAADLSISISSANQALLPTSAFQSNSVVTRGPSNPQPPPSPSVQTNYLSLYPVGTKGGESEITVSVSDGVNTVSANFLLVVGAAGNPLYENTAPINIPAQNTNGSPYPSSISVGGLVGTVENVIVTVFDVTENNNASGLSLLLVGPTNATGQSSNVFLMGDAGQGTGLASANLIFSNSVSGADTGAIILPESGQIYSTNIYIPTNYGPNAYTIPAIFGAPGPGVTGYGTNLVSSFNGINPNGTWSLYAYDTNGIRGGAIFGGWQLSIITAPNISPSTTNYTTPENTPTNIVIPVGDAEADNTSLTVTATVTASGLSTGPSVTVVSPLLVTNNGTANLAVLAVTPILYQFGTNNIQLVATDASGNSSTANLQVIVTFNPQPPILLVTNLSITTPAAVATNGIPFAVWDPQTTNENTISVSSTGLTPAPVVTVTTNATVDGTNSYSLNIQPVGVGTGTATITVAVLDGDNETTKTNFTLTVTPNLAFASTGSLTLGPGFPEQELASPYPWVTTVPNTVVGSVTGVKVSLLGITHNDISDVDVLLVSPDGLHSVVLMADAGDGGAVNNLNLEFSQTAGTAIPEFTPLPLTSATYQPANYVDGLTFPGPAPASGYSENLTTEFAGLPPSGNWSLYILDSAFPDNGSISGWILFLQTGPAITAISNPQKVSENGTLNVPVTLTDSSTSVANLSVIVTNSLGVVLTSNTAPLAVTQQGGETPSGVTNLVITPAPNYPSAEEAVNGLAPTNSTNVITVVVTDNDDNTVLTTFTNIVVWAPQAPVIVSASTNNLVINENSSGTISFTVSDVDSFLNAGSVDLISTNLGLVNTNGILTNAPLSSTAPGTVSGTITYQVTPATDVFDTNVGELVFSVMNSNNEVVTTNITLSVVHVIQQPTIAPFFAGAYQLFPGNTSTNIPFTVGTLESGATLNVTASSSDANVVPNSQNNIIINPPSFPSVSPGSQSGTIEIIIPSSAPPGVSLITVTNTQVVAGTTNAVTASFEIQVLKSPTTLFANASPIANVATNPIASPYPSTNEVTNLVGGVYSVSVTLNALSAGVPNDVSIVLEAPDGTSVLLLSDAGGTTPVENATLTFDDTNNLAPSNSPLALDGTSTNYHPTTYNGGNNPLPTNGDAPMPPYLDRMAVFDGINPNGTWKLWVVDNTSNDIVSIANGWTLSISTAPEIALDASPVPTVNIPENAPGQDNTGTVNFHVIDSTGGLDSNSITSVPTSAFSSITISGPTPVDGNPATNDYTATFTPEDYATGTNIITFTVNRADGASDSVLFTNVIIKSNMIPTLTRLNGITVDENETGQTEFFVTQLGDPLSTVTVTAYSTNASLVANSNIFFQGGSTTSGTITNTNMVNLSLFASSVPNAGDLILNMVPTANTAGQTLIVVLVSNIDGAFNSPTVVSNAFLLTVVPQTYNPTFATIPATLSVVGGNTVDVIFQVNSLDSTPPLITVSAVNQSVGDGVTIGTITSVAGPNGGSFTGSANNPGSTWTVPLIAAVTTSEYKSTIQFTAVDTNGGTATATLTLTTVPVLQHFYNNSTPIDIVDVSPSIPSPSVIDVSGLVGNISQVVVTLDGFGHQYPSDVGVLLVGPNGSNTVLMNNAGTGIPASGLNLTFSESAGAPVPPSQALSTGTFLPSDYQPVKPYNFEVSGPNNTPAYGPAGSTNPPPPSGPYATNLNVFNGLNPNTNWFLYVQDDSAGDVGNITGGWTLQIFTQPTIQITGLTTITTEEGNANGNTSFVILDDSTIAQANYIAASFGVTSTNIALVATTNVTFTGSGTNWTVNVAPTVDVAGSSLITIFATNSYGQISSNSFEITVTPVNFPPVITQPANGSTVTITAGVQTTLALGYSDTGYADDSLIVSATSTPLSSQNPVPQSSLALVANGSGPENLVITPLGTLTGSNMITLTVAQPGAGGITTNATFTLVVASGTVPIFASTNAITITSDSAATPYPSQIDVAGVGANILKVTATLVGFSHNFPSDVSALLVGPHGQNVMLFSDEGGALGVSNLRLTFDDSGTAMSPTGPLTSGTNAPALSDLRFIDNLSDVTNFSAQVSPPYGHTMSVFSNTAANGIWSLYVYDDSGPDTGAISGGWTLDIETIGPMITPLAPVIMSENTSVTIPFAISSATTYASNITVTASASSEVPSNLVASLVLTGEGSTNETLTITPTTNYPSAVTNINGAATITLILTDTNHNSSTNTFPLTVLPIDVPGIITLPVTMTNTPVNAPLSIPFTIFDVQGTSNLDVTASLAPDTGTVGITTNGAGSYTLTFTPDGATNTTTVTIVESDGIASASNSLQIAMTAGLPPAITIASNTTTPENSVLSIPFSLAYITVPFSTNNISAVASDTNLVASVTITTNAGGTNFFANVTLVPYTTGSNTIVISADDQYGAGSNSTLLTVTRVEYPPVLGTINDTNTLANTPVSIVLAVSDVATSITNLTYSAENSASNVIAAVNFSYVGTNEVVTLVPATNVTGVSAITVVVSDGVTNVSQAFAVTVIAPTPPTLAPIANQTTVVNTAVQVALNVMSPVTPITNLTFTSSAGTNLVESVTFQFVGSNEVATITPATGALGTGPVTISVNDPFSTNSQTFTLQVVSPAPPSLSAAVASGVLDIKFTGVPGASYTIQSSSDLITWTGVATVTANSVTGAAEYQVAISQSAPGLFYRIVGP